MPLFHALREFGGAARREQLLARGIRRWQLDSALKAGAITRPHRGVYSLPETSRDIVHARIFRASLACVSACEAYGLPVLERDHRTHLATECPRSMARPGIRPMDEVHIHLSSWSEKGALRVEPWVAIDQAGECVSPIAQLALVDAALSRGLMTMEQIGWFTRTPIKRRIWLRQAANAGAESPLETVARIRLRRAGFGLECQVPIEGVGRVDLLVEGRVVVELDGRAYHQDPEAFAKDRRRDRTLQILGYKVARFTWAEVMEDGRVLETAVAALLRQTNRLAA